MQEYQKVFENQNGYIKPSGGFFFAFLSDREEMDLFDTVEEAKSYLEKGAGDAPALPASWVLIPSGCDVEVMADREEELQALFTELAEEELKYDWKVAA